MKIPIRPAPPDPSPCLIWPGFPMGDSGWAVAWEAPKTAPMAGWNCSKAATKAQPDSRSANPSQPNSTAFTASNEAGGSASQEDFVVYSKAQDKNGEATGNTDTAAYYAGVGDCPAIHVTRLAVGNPG